MKKRIFAGALALLMIIGLLPVSSMVKKPMEAQAAATEYKFTVSSSNKFTADSKQGTDDFFTVNFKYSVDTKWNNIASVTKMQSKKGKISFDVKEKAVVTIKWGSTSDTDATIKLVNGSNINNYQETEKVGEKLKLTTSTFNAVEAGSYYIESTANVVINEISVVVGDDEQEDGYLVTIVDSANSESPVEYKNVKEGVSIKYTAQGADFAYWVNSYGVMVGTDRTLEIPAHYKVTYTAVYNTGVKVSYLTSYGSVYKSFALDELTEEPAGPTCYGYEFANWDMSLEDIKTKLSNNENVVVKPVYKSASNEYTITVDTTDLGGSRVTSTYGINTIVTATTSSNEFAYWVDASNNTVLSYSSTYLFFANKDIEVKAVKGASGKDDNAKAVITNVSNTTVDNTNVAIFEYNIPADYQITFAGVVASKTLTGDNLTAENNGAHVIGDSNLSYTTYRYTLSATKGTTWHVRPMMKYTYGGTTYTIYGQEITME